MSGSGRPFAAANDNDSLSKEKSIYESNLNTNQLYQGVADVNIDSGHDGGWEVYERKSKNRARSSAAKPQGPLIHNSNPREWGNTDVVQRPGFWNHAGAGRASGNPWQAHNANSRRPAGRGDARPQISASGSESANVTPNTWIHPLLEHGWNWQSKAGSMQPKTNLQGENEITQESPKTNNDVDDEGEDDSDGMEDTDDDLMSDDSESDSSQKSHDTRKKSKWFKKFFDMLNSLTVEEINEPERQWHCPAYQGGPGSIDWYKGLQLLMTHAKTKGSKRVKVHRELASLLDEELRRRGTTVVLPGEAFGKWKGLKDEEKDHEIVWPPMVIIQNTRLEQDDNEKWIGMANQELLDYFSSYNAVKAQHSYGPQGHRGMSVLIFEASTRGYFEAECLHKHFINNGTNRDALEITVFYFFLEGIASFMVTWLLKTTWRFSTSFPKVSQN